MFPGKQTNKKRAGQPLDARTINQLLDRVARLERMGAAAPLKIDQLPGGANLSWIGAIVDIQYFVPGGPIPAATGTLAAGDLTPGSGPAARYSRDPATGIVGAYDPSYTLYNWTPSQSGSATTLLICALINGDWTIIAEACPTS